MHAFNVFISGEATSAPQQTVEELGSVFPFPLSVEEHVNGTERSRQQIKSCFRSGKQPHKALYLLPAVALMLLLLNMYLCRLKKSQNVGAGDRIRRLANDVDLKGEKGKVGSRALELCGLLEGAVSSHEDERGIQAQLVQRPAALSEAVAEEKATLKKRKAKTRWLEEGAVGAERPKRAMRGKATDGCFTLQLQPAAKRFRQFPFYPYLDNLM